MARFKKPKQAPRQLQYIAKISPSVKLSLKFWVNIFRQKIHVHFRQKHVSPLSFQIGVCIKDSHCPLAGPCSQQLREGLKSTTVSPALLPHAEEDGTRTLLLALVSVTMTFASQYHGGQDSHAGKIRVFNDGLLASGLIIHGH